MRVDWFSYTGRKPPYPTDPTGNTRALLLPVPEVRGIRRGEIR